MPTLQEALDNLYTTTWQNMKSTASDNIFDAVAFWFWLRRNGGLERTEGGRWIGEPLRFAKSDNVKFVQKGEGMPLVDKEFLTTARYDWRYLADSIVRFGIDDQQNRGKNQIINLARAKLDNSMDSLTDKMEEVLFDRGGDALAFHSLKDIVPADPTVTGATLGGIDPSTETWWRNQTTDMAGESFATFGRRRMSTMLNKCSNNRSNDRPDIVVCSQRPWELYEATVIEQKRIVNKSLGDAQFQNIEFSGIPLIWSPKANVGGTAAGDLMYFLNTKRFMKFRFDPQMFFDMTRWKEIPNQIMDRAAQIITAGNLVTGRRRVHGVIHTIDTD